MLFFMGSSAHMQHGSIGANTTAIIICLVIIAALEANAIFGKQGPMTTVRGVILSSLVLTAILWGIVAVL